VTTVLLDTHALLWWSSEPDRISQRAADEISSSDDLAVSDISWYELARLAERERILVRIPIISWLNELARLVRTVPITPSIASTAAALPSVFPGDPADRLIYSTALENGCPLVTKDKRLRDFRPAQRVTVW
jgi:PIN domain nuclease of toxin-antitoxin system